MAFIIFGGYIALYAFHQWSPEKILKKYLASYQKKYPDISFSIKSYNSSFNGSYSILINDLVVTKEAQPIIKTDQLLLEIPLMTLLRDTGEMSLKIKNTYVFDSSHIFLEKEIDKLIANLSERFKIQIAIQRMEYLKEKQKIIFSNLELFNDNEIPGHEKIRVKSLVDFKTSSLKLSLELISDFDLDSLVKEKELRSDFHIEINEISHKLATTKKNLNQTIKIKSFLKTNGDHRSEYVFNGELLTGEGRLLLTKEDFELSNIDILFSLGAFRVQDLTWKNKVFLGGKTRLVGDFNLSNKSESSLELKSEGLFLNDGKMSAIDLVATFKDLIQYSFKTQMGGVSIEAQNKLSLNLSDHESSIKLSQSDESPKINQEIWKEVFHTPFFETQFLSQLEMQDISLNGQKLNGDIIWSRDSQNGSAAVISLETKKGSFKGRRMMTAQKKDCFFKLNNFPTQVLSWLSPGAWSNISGIANGEVTCPNKDQYKLSLKSRELIAPVFQINEPLKEAEEKIRYYKDDRFSSLRAIWDRGRIEKLEMKNRVYNIQGEREGDLMVLSLNKRELLYKEQDHEWKFLEVRK